MPLFTVLTAPQTSGVALNAHKCAKLGILAWRLTGAHSAEAPWPLKGAILRKSFSSLPFTVSDGKFLDDDARIFRFGQVFRLDSDPVSLLRTASRAEFAAADEQGASLGHEHPAILAPDHLCRPAFSRCYARVLGARGKKEPPGQANCQICQKTID